MNGSKLLDTNIAVALLNEDPRVKARMSDKVFLSSVVLGELYFGVVNSVRVKENLARIDRLIARSSVLNCDAETARHYGDVRLMLKRKGRPIPENDIWIAAIALQHNLTLVTRDVHFNEVENLQVEMW